MTDLADFKRTLRTDMAKRRKMAHEIARNDAPLALVAQPLAISPRPGASVVSGFHPYKSEIDVRPLLGKLAGEGWTTCLPEVIALGAPLVFRKWLPGEPTVPGVWDIPRPPHEAPIVSPDVLLVPLMAFDRNGFRLGYGGGFYDRTLENLRAVKSIIAIGVAYAAQEIDAVPRADHDAPLDGVLTEKEFFWVSR